MYPKILFVLPLLTVMGWSYASDEISPEMLAQIQTECAADAAKSGLSTDEREVMNWVCVSNLRDYDNTISDE